MELDLAVAMTQNENPQAMKERRKIE